MNISFPNSAAPSSKVESEQIAQNRNATQQPANIAASSSDVSLSASTVQSLKTQLSSAPNVREERVAALRQAVNSGQYNPSPQQIANAIHADLFGGATASTS